MAFVYLIREISEKVKYKIGMTRGTVEKRLKQLQTGNPNELTLIDSYQTENPFYIEKMLHFKYNQKNVMNEWFDLTMDEVSSFQDDCKNFEDKIKTLKDNPFIKLK